MLAGLNPGLPGERAASCRPTSACAEGRRNERGNWSRESAETLCKATAYNLALLSKLNELIIGSDHIVYSDEIGEGKKCTGLAQEPRMTLKAWLSHPPPARFDDIGSVFSASVTQVRSGHTRQLCDARQIDGF